MSNDAWHCQAHFMCRTMCEAGAFPCIVNVWPSAFSSQATCLQGEPGVYSSLCTSRSPRSCCGSSSEILCHDNADDRVSDRACDSCERVSPGAAVKNSHDKGCRNDALAREGSAGTTTVECYQADYCPLFFRRRKGGLSAALKATPGASANGCTESAGRAAQYPSAAPSADAQRASGLIAQGARAAAAQAHELAVATAMEHLNCRGSATSASGRCVAKKTAPQIGPDLDDASRCDSAAVASVSEAWDWLPCFSPSLVDRLWAGHASDSSGSPRGRHLLRHFNQPPQHQSQQQHRQQADQKRLHSGQRPPKDRCLMLQREQLKDGSDPQPRAPLESANSTPVAASADADSTMAHARPGAAPVGHQQLAHAVLASVDPAAASIGTAAVSRCTAMSSSSSAAGVQAAATARLGLPLACPGASARGDVATESRMPCMALVAAAAAATAAPRALGAAAAAAAVRGGGSSRGAAKDFGRTGPRRHSPLPPDNVSAPGAVTAAPPLPAASAVPLTGADAVASVPAVIIGATPAPTSPGAPDVGCVDGGEDSATPPQHQSFLMPVPKPGASAAAAALMAMAMSAYEAPRGHVHNGPRMPLCAGNSPPTAVATCTSQRSHPQLATTGLPPPLRLNRLSGCGGDVQAWERTSLRRADPWFSHHREPDSPVSQASTEWEPHASASVTSLVGGGGALHNVDRGIGSDAEEHFSPAPRFDMRTRWWGRDPGSGRFTDAEARRTESWWRWLLPGW